MPDRNQLISQILHGNRDVIFKVIAREKYRLRTKLLNGPAGTTWTNGLLELPDGIPMSTLTDSKRQTTLERWAFTIEFALANLREFEQKILAARGDWVRLVSAGVIPYSDWMDDVLREEFWRREINFAHREMHDAGAKLISGLQVLARETQRTTLAIITKLSRVRAFSPMPLEMRPQVQPMAEPFYV